MTTVDFPILTVLIFLPLIAAGLLVFIPNPVAARRFALAASLAELLLSLILLGLFDFGSSKLQLIERAVWIPSLNVFYTVGGRFLILFAAHGA